jgi:hypothetical protein
MMGSGMNGDRWYGVDLSVGGTMAKELKNQKYDTIEVGIIRTL